MTNHDLLDLIGEARGEYLLEVQVYREMQEEPENTALQRRISFRKALLIAAVIAVTLLLVGCTVVYVLSMQEMKVGEHVFTEPAHINESGETIPAEQKTTALVSLQGIYQPALEEWIAFTDSYDPDKSLLMANDHNESEVPEPYYTTYGCYTWEMVNKLDTIIRKYDLKLLEPYILIQDGEEEILFEALKMENIHKEYANAEVEYSSGYFYPEGTFQVTADVAMTEGDWRYGNFASIRYSLKAYFDPVPGSVGDIESYVQWNYTTEDGLPVLLAMNADYARIYANLTDAFVSVQMNAYSYVDGEKVPMPQEALQQLAEVFDFAVKPQSADLELVNRMQAEAAAKEEAETADARANEEAMIAAGYETYLEYRLEAAEDPGNLRYSVYDLNGDGTDELILRDGDGYCHEILSVKNGQTFLYFNAGKVTAASEIHPCGNRVFLLFSAYGDFERYKFYQARSDGVTYIVGLTYDPAEDRWYYYPDDDPWTDNDEIIIEADARKIIDTYTPTQMLGDPKPAAEFSQETLSEPVDPYAAVVADWLNGETAEKLRYTLRDLDGDDVEELLIESSLYVKGEERDTCLSIYGQKAGELVDLNIVIVQYVCKDNVLEECYYEENGAENHTYYQLSGTGMRIIDIIKYDPLTDTWTRDIDGYWGETAVIITESYARSIIGGYKRLTLDMKPLAEYPIR